MVLSNNLKIKHLEKIGLPLVLFPLFYFDEYSVNDINKLLVSLGISLIIFSNTNSSYLTKLLSFKFLGIIEVVIQFTYYTNQFLFF